jgi:hypothetical protein
VEKYLIDGSDYEDFDSFCFLAVFSGIPDYYGLNILGDIFLRNYVSVFDLKNSKVALGLSVYSPEAEVIEIEQNVFWLIFLILLALVIVGSIVFFCIRRQKQKRSKGNEYYKRINTQTQSLNENIIAQGTEYRPSLKNYEGNALSNGYQTVGGGQNMVDK